MPAKPLSLEFPMASELAQRPPRLVATDELLLELEDELGRRAEVYPAMVKRGTMTEQEAKRHNTVWQWMIADHRGDAYAGDWEARIRELRRELALRRNLYPKWIASPTNPLTAAEGTRRVERLDAVHWRYWMQLWRFSERDPVDDYRRHAWAARLERRRRQGAWSAAKAGSDAKASDRAMLEERAWRAIEIYAGMRAGDASEFGAPDGDTIRAMAAIAGERLEAVLFLPSSAEADAIIAQLAPLTRWLERDAGRTFKAIREERMAA